MVQYYVSSTDWEVGEFRKMVNKVVVRMGIVEGARRCRFQGYDEDGDAVFKVDESIAPKLIEVASGLGGKVFRIDTSEMGEQPIVDKR